MHEMALTRDALDLIIAEGEKAGAERVCTVTLSIGYMRDIVEDIFEGLFAHLAKGTIVEGAELNLVRTPAIVECQDCGGRYHLDVFDSSSFDCPRCSARNYRLISGMDFNIDNIGIVPKPEYRLKSA